MVPERLGGKGADLPAKRHDAALAIGMQAVTEEYHKGSRAGIDPGRCAGKAGMPEGADGKMAAARAAVHGVNIPAKRAARGPALGVLHIRRLDARPFGDGFFFKHAHAVQFAVVEQHAAEPGEVGRGGEEPGMAGHAAGLASPRVVHRAAQPLAVLKGVGRNAIMLGGWRIVAGVSHFQRAEDFIFAEDIQSLAADAPDDFIEQLEIDVAVNEHRAGRMARCLVATLGNALGVPIPSLKRDIRAQAAGMGEQLADGDWIPAITGKFRDVFCHLVIQPEFAPLPEPQYGRCGGKSLGK